MIPAYKDLCVAVDGDLGCSQNTVVIAVVVDDYDYCAGLAETLEKREPSVYSYHLRVVW